MVKKLLGLGLLIVTMMFVMFLIGSKKRPTFKEQPVTPKFKVITEQIAPKSADIKIKANSNIEPRWQTQLTSEVSGKVQKISSNLFAGSFFKKGDVLIEIDSLQYEVELNQQLSNLADTEQLLEEEKVRSERAYKDWQSLNSKRKASDYTLRKPQLKAAQLKYNSAVSKVKFAKENLTKTKIRAPYDGYVESRKIDIGELVQVGTNVADVFSSGEMELQISLLNDQVELIESGQTNSIIVHNPDNIAKQWKAKYSRSSQMINQNDRWRTVFLEVSSSENIDKPLPVSGSFLSAELSLDLGIKYLVLKEKSLSIDGSIWWVDNNNILQKYMPMVEFKNLGYVYARPDEKFNYPIDLVSFPSPSLLEGMEVVKEQMDLGVINAP